MFDNKLTKKFSVPALVAVASFSLLSACSDSDNDSETSVSTTAVKTNYVKMAYAVYADSLSTAETLQTSVNTFLETPNEINLTAARTAYKATRKPYQQSEIMRWDGAITEGQNLDNNPDIGSVDDWEGQVNAWPLDETLIDALIAGTETIDADLLINNFEKDGNEANVTTGVHAIEFMLWDRDQSGPARGPGTRTAAEFGANADCLTQTGTQCRNSAYLKAATDLLVTDLAAMTAEWSESAETTQGTLADNFLNSNEALDYMAQSIASMAVGELGGARLSAGLWRPALTAGGADKVGDFEEEHDCFSDLSHYAVYYNFQAVRNAFYGTYTAINGDVIEGTSFADYIKSKDVATYESLDAVLSAAQAEMLIVFEAGERAVDPKSFDSIIADSQAHYENDVAKTPELTAVENALDELAKIENIVLDVRDVLQLSAFDADAIGETD